MAEEKKGFFKRLVAGLAKTRDTVVSGMDPFCYLGASAEVAGYL